MLLDMCLVHAHCTQCKGVCLKGFSKININYFLPCNISPHSFMDTPSTTVDIERIIIRYFHISMQDILPDHETSNQPVSTILTVVSYIGSSLSVIALVIALVTYLAEK